MRAEAEAARRKRRLRRSWTGPVWTGPDRTGPDWTGLERTGLNRTGPDRTGPDWTGPDWTGPDRTGPDWTGPDWTGLDRSEGAKVWTHSATFVTEEVCMCCPTKRGVSQGGGPNWLGFGGQWGRGCPRQVPNEGGVPLR